jgi:hypothetical protein
MTARWSGIVPRRAAETPRIEEDLEAESWRVYPRREAGSLRRGCFDSECS